MWTAIFILLHSCIVLIFGYRIIQRKLAVTTTLAWISFVMALPLIGLGIYFVLGDTRLDDERRKASDRLQALHLDTFGVDRSDVDIQDLDIPVYFKDVANSITNDTGFHPSQGNSIQLFTGAAEKLDAIVKDIDDASRTVDMEFYTIDPQGRVENVIAALERAAGRGVACRVLVDQMGSEDFLDHAFKTRLEEAGVQVVTSLSINFIEVFLHRKDLRNHRKLIIIDHKVGYTGSYNLEDPDYFMEDEDPEKWVDILMRLEGHVVGSLATILHTDFMCDRGDLEAQAPDASASDYEKRVPKGDDGAVIQVIPSGPEMQPSLIYNLIVSAIFGAEKKITVITPYFVPDDAFLLALTTAAKRGRDVTLILPKELDSILVKYSSQASFSTLLDAGVKIMWFKTDMLHTKALLIDDGISFVGTVNMDMRSFYLNLELTMVVYDEGFAAEMAAVADSYLENCEAVDPEIWEQRGKRRRFRENVLRLAAPVL